MGPIFARVTRKRLIGEANFEPESSHLISGFELSLAIDALYIHNTYLACIHSRAAAFFTGLSFPVALFLTLYSFVQSVIIVRTTARNMLKFTSVTCTCSFVIAM